MKICKAKIKDKKYQTEKMKAKLSKQKNNRETQT